MQNNNLITVFTGTQAKAALIKSLLDAEGIFCVFQNMVTGSIAPMYIGGGFLQAVSVAVRKSDQEKADEIIKQLD